MANQCQHHWDLSRPIEGVVYQRCRLCKTAVALDADGKGPVEVHASQLDGPRSPWWKMMHNRERHQWFLQHRRQIQEDSNAYGRKGAQRLWGMASSATLHQLLTDEPLETAAPEAVPTKDGFGHLGDEALRRLPKVTKRALVAEAQERGVKVVAEEKGIPMTLLKAWLAAYSPKRKVAKDKAPPQAASELPQPATDHLHPAIVVLLQELPAPGTPLTDGRKEALRLYFSAVVDLIYPDQPGSETPAAAGRRTHGQS